MKDYDLNKLRTWGVYVPDEAIDRVIKVLESRWLNTGSNELEFREVFKNKFNIAYCIATNSGTSSLRTIYSMLNITNGDEVITTPYTFIATNTAILEQGATPIFADIKYDDLNIDPNSIYSKITKKTKAIVVVHYAGNPVDLDKIRKIGEMYNIPIIEDSCHALGSKYKGEYIGEDSELAAFSLQSIKIVTCGDGGIIATSNSEYYDRLKKKVWFGVDRDKKQNNLFFDPLPDEIDVLGFKYNMNDIVASLAIAAINNFDTPFLRRKEIGQIYRKELSDCKKIKTLCYYNDREPNYQIFPIHVEDRFNFAKYMWNNGIQVVVNNRRNDKYKIFGGINKDLINTEKADDDVILLPIHYDLSNSEIDKVITLVKKWDNK